MSAPSAVFSPALFCPTGHPAERPAIGLAQDGLTVAQAARAIRFALTAFTSGTPGHPDTLDSCVAQTHRRARSARADIAERQFTLVYQPVVRLADRRVRYYEALLRPRSGPVPRDFVSFAETMGLAEELDEAVFAEILAALRADPAVSIAVNISGLSLQSPPFRDRMLATLHAQDAELRARLLIELTETAEIDDLPTASATLARLRSAGITVCIDDFGAGAASLRYLRDLPVDIVKIDGAYVRAAATGKRDRDFLVHMLDLAHAAGAQTVAEMIETEAEAALMAELGVTLGQGWFLGRPKEGRPGALPPDAPLGPR